MRAWRGPHKVVQVFQEGRVYVLDTGQKVHFERLKPHHSGPLELATAQADSGEIVVLMDPDPERSIEVVDDDKSQPSYKTEQLLSEDFTGLNATFAWGPDQQKAFNEIKKALIEATALAQPDSEEEFVLDTDASAVAISGILHQWQGAPGEQRLRPIIYGSKKLTTTQAKYWAPKLEMFAAYYFILKYHSYLCPRKFTLRVDNKPYPG